MSQIVDALTGVITEGARVPGAGFFEMDEALYHADPAPGPSLSSTIAKRLIDGAPALAAYRHPRINPGVQQDAEAHLDFGTLAHTLLLGKGRDVVVVSADDWRTKAAQQARDEARAAGKLPVLAKTLDKAMQMRDAARGFLKVCGLDHAYTNEAGRPEIVGVWQDSVGCWGRFMMDWVEGLDTETPVLWDYKTTSASAAPGPELARTFANYGYDVSAAHYLRGLAHLRPEVAGRARFRWLVQETEAPFLCSIVELGEGDLYVAARKVAFAFERWNRCLKAGMFPAYPAGVCEISMPVWHQDAWTRREEFDAEMLAAGRDPFLMLAPFVRVAAEAPKQLMEPV